MRVLFTTFDSRGGVEPMLAAALRLQDLDVAATVCAPPDCADRAGEVGVPFVPIGVAVKELVHGARPPSPADIPQRAAEILTAQYDLLPALAEQSDLIVASGVIPAVAGARSVAEKVRIPTVLLNYCPMFLPSPHHEPHPAPGRPFPPEVTDHAAKSELQAEGYNAIFREVVNTHRRALGLAEVDNVRDFVYGDGAWVAADQVLAPWRAAGDYEVVQTGAWMVADDRPLPAEVVQFLEAGPPAVYVGFGSMRPPPEFAAVAIEAVRAHGRRVLLARGWADLEPVDESDDCLVIGEMNHQALFPQVAAVVHHGGAGTTHTAARAGAPQAIVPQLADQPYWASRVADLGIGAAHDGPTPTVESLTATLATALTPETKRRASAVADTIRPDGAAVAATLLVEAIRATA